MTILYRCDGCLKSFDSSEAVHTVSVEFGGAYCIDSKDFDSTPKLTIHLCPSCYKRMFGYAHRDELRNGIDEKPADCKEAVKAFQRRLLVAIQDGMLKQRTSVPSQQQLPRTGLVSSIMREEEEEQES